MQLPQNKLRILKICSSRAWGGLELLATILCEKLRERGHEVIPVCYQGSRIDQRLQQTGFQPKYLNIKQYFHPFKIHQLAKIVKQTNVDLIHSDYSKDLWTIVPALYFSKQVPIVLIKHIGTQKPKRDFLHAWIYRHVGHMIAISAVIRNNVINTHPIDSDRVSVIHNGISLERFNPRKVNRENIRKELSISADEIIIGIIGRLQIAKGHLEFLKMASAISQLYNNVRFMIVGEATRGHEAEAQMILDKIEAYSLNKKVIYTGYRDDVPSLLAAMDLFVFPSRAEAFGLVLIEAMAMKLPVIACRSDGVLDIVVDHKTGLLFTPKNVQELKQAVINLLEYPEKRSRLGQAGYQRVIEMFSDKLMLDKIEALYYALINHQITSSF